MKFVPVSKAELAVWKFLRNHPDRTLSQVTRKIKIPAKSTRKIIRQLKKKNIVAVKLIPRAGGFFDKKPLELYSALIGFSPGAPDKLYAQTIFQKHLGGNTINFVVWLKRRFGPKRARQLLIASGIYGKSN